MATAGQGATGSGWFSKLVVVLLLALAIGLYLQIVMVAEPARDDAAGTGTGPQASVQVVEDAGPGTPAAGQLVDLPQGQVDLILRVFAPELAN